jgi:hypothetical protein
MTGIETNPCSWGVLVNDVDEFFEQKKLAGIGSDTSPDQDAAEVGVGELTFDYLFGSLPVVHGADFGFVAALV